jgi:hypothetical protein
MDVDGDGFPQDVERDRGGFGGLSGGCRATRRHPAASIAPTEVSIAPHIQFRRVSA